MEPTKFDMKYAAVRRAIIEQRFSKLNDKQREAVYQTEGPLLILAGAGSGKTTVLINRIINILKPENRARAEHLCAMNPARPWQVIAITFTNKAARELRERLEFALGDEEAASAVWAYTFHTACLRILRKHVDLLGFESAFTIYDEDDKKRVILNVMKKLDLDPKNFDPRTVMGMISRAKDKLMTPRQFSADATGDYFREKVADVYRDYEKAMKRYWNIISASSAMFSWTSIRIPTTRSMCSPACWQVIMRTSAWSVMTTRVFTSSAVQPSRTFWSLKSSSRTRKPSVWNRITARPATF